MTLFVVDVESDGPCPGLYSMVSCGIVKVDRNLNSDLFLQFAPISDKWNPAALAVSGVSRQEHINFPPPITQILKLSNWILKHTDTETSPIFISDNPAFDWQFINYYFHQYIGQNPFGYSARRIGDFFAGLVGDWNVANRWKHLRKTKHTHNPVDDARGNAEALLKIAEIFNINLFNVEETNKN